VVECLNGDIAAFSLGLTVRRSGHHGSRLKESARLSQYLRSTWACLPLSPSKGHEAIVYDRYGPSTVLRVDDIASPSPAPGRCSSGSRQHRSTSATGRHCAARRCTPGWADCVRPHAARWAPTSPGGWRPSGQGVTRFRTGDQVYGDNLALKGGFAEYAVAAESTLAHKPAELTFAQTSTIPQAGAIALQGTGGAAAGDRVLINGAGGGSGSFAVQLAKRMGAHMTGVDNAAKLEFMQALGADDVIDYREEDFTQPDLPYDLILDLVAHRSVFAYRRALVPGGRYRCVGGPVRALLRVMTVGWIAGRLTNRRMGMLAVREGPAHFKAVADLCIAGNVAIHIARTYGLEEVPDALAYVGEGHALGKIVFMIEASENGQNTNQRSLH